MSFILLGSYEFTHHYYRVRQSNTAGLKSELEQLYQAVEKREGDNGAVFFSTSQAHSHARTLAHS